MGMMLRRKRMTSIAEETPLGTWVETRAKALSTRNRRLIGPFRDPQERTKQGIYTVEERGQEQQLGLEHQGEELGPKHNNIFRKT
jgi:hypothetical protein